MDNTFLHTARPSARSGEHRKVQLFPHWAVCLPSVRLSASKHIDVIVTVMFLCILIPTSKSNYDVNYSDFS